MKKNFKQITSSSLQQALYGQSLIEVVISIAIAAILAVSILSTTLLTQKTSNSAKNNTEATKLAQQAIEQLRVFRDIKGFGELKAEACGINTSDNNPNNWILITAPASCPEAIHSVDPENSTTLFYRRIEISNKDPVGGGNLEDKVFVTVTITWEEGGGLQSVNSKTYLSKWQNF